VIAFFEQSISGHDKVLRVSRQEDILFHVQRASGDTLNVLLVNEYTIGLAALLRAKAEFPSAEFVVTGGGWNGYTPEAKDYGRKDNIGVFNNIEFLGALNWTDPKSYHRRDRDGNPVYAYKGP
jgi:hypothetical protein